MFPRNIRIVLHGFDAEETAEVPGHFLLQGIEVGFLPLTLVKI